jgi:hypothetical protein
MELEHDGVPVSVTLVKPSEINTPYTSHARNYLSAEPQNPPPVYAPELVARAILRAAQVPTRDVVIGGGGRAITMAGVYAPRLIDKVMEWTMFGLQKSKRPSASSQDALYHAGEDLHEEGEYPGFVRRSSTYFAASQHPILTAAMAIGAGLMLAGWVRGSGDD